MNERTYNRRFDYRDLKNVKQRLALYDLHAEQTIRYQLEDAETVMCMVMQEFLGTGFTWLPEYDQVAEWLTNTDGKGLLLYGDVGVGKTIISRFIIPGIFEVCHHKLFTYYDYYDINKKADEIMSKKFAVIDDIGNEEQYSHYGNKQWVLPQIIDRAEKNNNLLVLTTNLNGSDLLDKYGSRTVDRIKAITRRVKIEHKSFRK